MAPLSDPHQGRGRALAGSFLLFSILPPIAVVMRIWARRIKRTPLCFNDYTIIVATILTCGFDILPIITALKGGFGQHLRTLTSSELTVYLKSTVAATLLWPTANTLIKISVLHFYVKVFTVRKMALCAFILAVLTMVYWLSTVLTAFLICRPFAYNWNRVTIKGSCGNTVAYYLSTAIVNMLIDVAIVALPMPLVWGLQMKTSRKLVLTGIFGLGAVICAISIVRIDSVAKLNIEGDVTYDIVLNEIVTALEPTLGVINACLPILQPVMSKVAGSTSLVWSRWRSGGGTSCERFGTKGASLQPSEDPEARKFHRLAGDLYPLTEFNGTQSHCSGPGGRTISDKDTESLNDEFERLPGIKVKQYVGVNSATAP